MRRKWRFLREEMRLATSQVMAAPALLALALTQVVGPRFHLLQVRGQLHRVQGLLGHEAARAASTAEAARGGGTRTAGAGVQREPEAGIGAQQSEFAYVSDGGGLNQGQGSGGRAGGVKEGAAGECVSLRAFAEMPLAQFCSTFGLQPQAWRDYKVSWWRTHGLRWGGVNMQLPENTAGWRHSHEAAVSDRAAPGDVN